MPQPKTHNSEENDVALALIRFRSGTPTIQSPVKQVPFNPEMNRRGIFTLCGRKPIRNFPYQGSTKNGKPHTEKKETGVEFFEIAGNLFLYVGSYCEGNPHGEGVLYRNLTRVQDIEEHTYVCGMKIEDWKEKSKNFKDFSFLSINKDYTCMYVGTFSKKKPFHITGKGVYKEHDCTINGKFKTEESDSDTKALLFKFDGCVHIDYRSGDFFDGLLHDYDEFYPAHGVYQWKEGHRKTGSFSDPYSQNDNVHAVYVDGKDYSVYHGKFLHWQKHGAGKLTFSSGETFSGVWKDDVPLNGILSTPKKDHLRKYTGNVDKSFKSNGNGKLEHYHDKELTYSFEGSFKNGKPHGEGTEIRIFKGKFAGTRIVTGTWEAGTWVIGKEVFTSSTNPECNYQREGIVTKGLLSKGTYWHATGDEYHGNFDSNGQASGFGTLTEQSGKFSFGNWRKNKQHGVHRTFQRGTLSSAFGVDPKQFNFTESEMTFVEGAVTTVNVLSKKRKQSDYDEFKKECRQKLDIP